VDTSFDPDSISVREVAFLSPEYFTLAESGPEAAAALSLGTDVLLVQGDIAVRIVGPAHLEGSGLVTGEEDSTGNVGPSAGGPAPGGSIPGTEGPLLPCAAFPAFVSVGILARRRRHAGRA
ncbi:MAG: hypothetical protein ACRDG5_04880, partial [Anaerolineales bacterium]